MEDKEPFDSRLLKDYKIGDLVSWKSNGSLSEEERQYGFIQNIYSQDVGANREFIFAKVIKTNGSTENFMLSALSLESGNNKDILQ